MKAQFINGKCLKPHRFHLRNEEDFDMDNYHHLWNSPQLESPQALRDFILESDGLTTCEQRAYKALSDWHSGALRAQKAYEHVIENLAREERQIYNMLIDEADFYRLVPKAGDAFYTWKELERPWKLVLDDSDFKERVSSYDWVLNDEAAEWYGEHYVHDRCKARKLLKKYKSWIFSGGWKTAKTGWVKKCGLYLSREDVESNLSQYLEHSPKSCPRKILNYKLLVEDFDYEINPASEARRLWMSKQGM